jgi:hypothetical protein
MRSSDASLSGWARNSFRAIAGRSRRRDMHVKNMALPKVAEPGDSQFRTVRMATLYDAVTDAELER